MYSTVAKIETLQPMVPSRFFPVNTNNLNPPCNTSIKAPYRKVVAAVPSVLPHVKPPPVFLLQQHIIVSASF